MSTQIKFKPFAILTLVLLCNFVANAQEKYSNNSLSAGLRFNNPFGVSVKKNWNDKAIELVVGKENPWRYNGYRHFRHKNFGNEYHYNGYDPIYRPVVFQIHYMQHNRLPKIPQLSIYYGGGVQARNYAYDIKYTYESNGVTYNDSYRQQGFGLGVDALAGLEFKVKSIPLVIFSDLTLYTEIAQQPLCMNFNSSWGIRYYWE